MSVADAAALLSSGNLFARKFDANFDPEILDVLERHLDRQDVANVDATYAAPASAA